MTEQATGINYAAHFLAAMTSDLEIAAEARRNVRFVGTDTLRSVYPVSAFATAAIAAAGAAVAELIGTQSGELPAVTADQRLSSLWYSWSIRPDGWAMPPAWDAIAGDYATADGWIRLHTNAPHHRDAALAVLGVGADKEQVQRAVKRWHGDALEAAIVEQHGCAAAMRSASAWAAHTQGLSVALQPLLAVQSMDDGQASAWRPQRERPLAGVRVLDLTRILAGPVATRFLAGYGARVLRIDPPGWDEPAVAPEITLGKQCARLDLRDAGDKSVFIQLLSQADVLVHGYRADALERLGLGAEMRRRIYPGLIDVCLNAYGWAGPWQYRRGFDSLVQMSTGIADAGMRQFGADRPAPLPVQALDHATGYLMAAAVVRGLTQRLRSGRGFQARASLARTAQLLLEAGPRSPGEAMAAARDSDYASPIELSAFGPAQRLLPPLSITQAPMRWDAPAVRLGSSPAAW